MTIKSTRLGFVHLVVALPAILVVIAVVACNGILGNVELTADAGGPVLAPDTGPQEKCPGKKFCSAIDSCGPKDDPSFGCASAACEPCSVPNATAKCGSTGCTVKECFPGFFECKPGTCVDLSESANCGKCGVPCASSTPFCAPSPPGAALLFSCVATCPPPQEPCGSADRCFDLTKATAHCGSCKNDCRPAGGGNPPNGSVKCENSTCVLDCLPGFRKCGAAGAETCERQDAEHCGASCMACPTGPNGTPSCNAGPDDNDFTCGFDCDGVTQIFQQCPPAPGCVDTRIDPSNCGDCGKECVPLAGNPSCTCSSRKCTAGCVPTL